MKHEEEEREKAAGVAYIVIAYVVWGLLPLYWKYLDDIPAFEILAHRIFWSFVFVVFLLFFYRRWNVFATAFKNRNNLLFAFFSSVLISANWFVYIWGVNNGHVVEASLGYYINPLLNVVLGVLVLRERLTGWQITALALASVGVAILTVQHGRIPWIAVALATTFALYGLVKKKAQTEALVGLVLETAFMAPLALMYILLLETRGSGALGYGSSLTLLMLVGTGVVTALPLLWFAKGARVVPLSTIGFIQYVSPTISLLIGVFVFKEAFTFVHLVSFSLIWSALLLYSLSYTNVLSPLSRYRKPGSYSGQLREKKHFH
ncbi:MULTISPECIES: EamA family transporter RarD [Aneurinibacillus]|uniref:Chloramphenicol-sensitive protein RarD n=1 Tax=Aneurinibacillus thermoaerophilus TaxID=143495 RepID=A0A1G7XCR5_ANETH|nr:MULTISPECIES: EamA family transporter RarD [Aneurinibacillus]AMA73292.1 transporter [Aneurinibacillus sp. XH2]MED0674268.1 EamA family transporter RarD [Aneurinibacillus thermoaerophilus]MED0678286.1 EamA family transporter RarD [Aneurinibacillus thermoaerophilus]MED0736188.1 EamA family transporter RarD [Aneurinibacillus thermoaerophilus]MED0757034.1 EamA family transporter RarD [Aneurinibacillus thermoaerophilus]